MLVILLVIIMMVMLHQKSLEDTNDKIDQINNNIKLGSFLSLLMFTLTIAAFVVFRKKSKVDRMYDLFNDMIVTESQFVKKQ